MTVTYYKPNPFERTVTMTKHIKPTTEELEAGALAKAAEAEAMMKEEEKKEEKPEELEIAPSEAPKEEVPEEKEEEKPPEPDYREKFKASSKEALVLHAKAEQTEKMNKAIESADTITEIPEDVIKKEYPEWDEMTQTEQRLAKESYISNKRWAAVKEASPVGKDIEVWGEKVDGFITDPKTLVDIPELEGKQDDFKIFAMQKSRRNVDFDTLVAAFLYDATKNAQPKKGKMFEEGTGGDNEKPKPKSDKITLQQARTLRKENYPKYKELLQAGKIEDIKE